MAVNLVERLRAAWHGLTGKAAGSDNVTWAVTTWGDQSRSARRFNYTAVAQEGFMTNEVVYAVITDIAESAAEPTLRVYDADDEEQPEHPARRLIAQPNPVMTEFELWELILIQLCLAGNAFVQKVRSRSGTPVQLWPIWIPSRMTPVPDPKKHIRQWLYRKDDGEQIPLDPADIIHFKYPHPLNPYLGLAPMVVAARAVDRDNRATDFMNAFFENAAVPQGLLKFKRHTEEGEADRIRALWKARYGGERGWYDVAVLDADTEYQRLGLTQQEMAMPDLNDLSEERICMIFKWPPVLIGALVGLRFATYSNVREARKIAWEDTLAPIYARFQARVNHDLAGDFGLNPEDTPLRWDFSAVKALQEDEESRVERMRQAFLARAIKRNEYREALGLRPDADGDTYLSLPGGLVAETEKSMLAYPLTAEAVYLKGLRR